MTSRLALQERTPSIDSLWAGLDTVTTGVGMDGMGSGPPVGCMACDSPQRLFGFWSQDQLDRQLPGQFGGIQGTSRTETRADLRYHQEE